MRMKSCLNRKKKQKKKEKRANILRQTCSRLAGLTVKRCHKTGSHIRKGLRRLDKIQLSVVIEQKRRNYRKPEGDWLGLRKTCGDG